ncbi:alpha-amylase family glycosyl hydrolase [Chryseolinea lacunae]|uniref:Cyclomaltodextrinase N-terminal domain-containing protein n=1 Tax=Chryseolinea lacunae TaxID=2801331 RepID=A0ABS1L4X3_9BACT|nr:alpha-amylase family glycosyl hydrolase [Chryseolinea lacunae]MBL0745611.1 cyclomaltodextrinase N-terminal domain-containing protein [Chryseolinea lacunae]
MKRTSAKFLKIMLMSCAVALCSQVHAQSVEVYPPHWWVDMKWNKVQLLVHGTQENFNKSDVTLTYPGITLDKVHRLENSRYYALDITVAPGTKPGNVSIDIGAKGKMKSVAWSLLPRRTGKGTTYAQGVNAGDFMYLLMPDRFSNGDVTNDRVAGMRDQTLNRDSIYHRHGGDLQGVINHLDYLQSMGVTALWMTPVIENNMPNRTEHGYAITNHYKIDPRLGNSDTYKKLSDELHKRGMKLVQDAVYNHSGLYHVTVQDKPVKDWLHEWPTYTNTNYRDATWMDPHGNEAERKRMADGWFTPMMPDLNHGNLYMANYLIQHALWSVEEFGVDAWRIDTYIYCDLEFMNRCNAALLDEYPNLHLFGECWVTGTMNQAYFVENNISTPFKSNLPGATDFQTVFSIVASMQNANDGLNRFYAMLSNDFAYKDPMKMVTFLDNHDMTRFYTQVGEDLDKYKIGLGWLLTGRGIPQLYYGDEVLMKGATHPADGWVRLDFPGGWKGDKKNAFTGENLSAIEKQTQEFLKTLANFRKHSSAIRTGKLMQYIPQDGLYVYFRYDDAQTLMCVINLNEASKNVSLSDYAERTKSFVGGKDVVSGKAFGSTFSISGKSMLIIELGK